MMRQVETAQQLGVQQAVVDPEMDIVPGHQHQDFHHHFLPAWVRVQMRPTQLQQAPGKDHAGAEQQDGQPGLREFTA
ncbi:hypothetical protein D3C72_1556230 [compost metagenome]